MTVGLLSSTAPATSLRSEVVAAVRQLSFDMSAFIPLLVEFDLSGEWAFDNAASCAHWIAERADVELCTVREWLRIGHALPLVDEVARRFADGRLSYSKVRALTRLADADNQHDLCAIAERVPAAGLASALARWLKDNEAPDDLERRHRAATKLSWHLDVDGMVVGVFRYPPAEAAILRTAVDAQVLRAQRGRDASAGDRSSRSVRKWPTLAQQRADALIALITGGGATVLTEVVLHVRGDGCSLDDGTPIADSAVAGLIPETFIRALIHDAESRPVNASGRQRHPTVRQKRVVFERDGCCVDCGSTTLLQYDHDPDYEETKHTIVEQLKIRCWRCHRDRHAAKRAASTIDPAPAPSSS